MRHALHGCRPGPVVLIGSDIPAVGTRHSAAAFGLLGICDLVFGPAADGDGTRLPVVWYLSGLAYTHANVTEKGEFREVCTRLGLVLVAPDTSPRGEAVPDDPTGAYDFGLGAGFYVDATEQPFASNYRMWTYVTTELPALAESSFPVDLTRQAIMGHSMGGHGALIIGLRHPDRFRSLSAFSPIVAPSV
jgi:S-formylglutathione hydrolase